MNDQQQLSLIVERQFSGSSLQAVTKLVGGVSAEVFQLQIVAAGGSRRNLVLRVHGQNHCGHGAELEFGLLRALSRMGLPVPGAICFDATREVLGYPYLLLDFVEGSTEIPEESIDRRISAMAECLATVHAAQFDDLPPLPTRLDPLPELFGLLPSTPEWRNFRARLQKLEDTAFIGTPVLLHGDFWPANIIWREGRIAAVLDWEDAALGDPISDVACTCLELRYLYGEQGANRFLEAYGQHRTLNLERLPLWQAYVAAAGHDSMGGWGLAPSREAEMRRVALLSLREAASSLHSPASLQ